MFKIEILRISVTEVKSLSRVRLFVTPWTVAHQASPSMEVSRQEYWSGLPFPSPGDLPDPGIEPGSPALQADALPSEPPGKPSKCRFLTCLWEVHLVDSEWVPESSIFNTWVQNPKSTVTKSHISFRRDGRVE